MPFRQERRKDGTRKDSQSERRRVDDDSRAKAAEQLFRLRFQKSLGNQEGIKKLRVLKLDIARIQDDRARACDRCRQGGEPRSVATRRRPRAHGPRAARKRRRHNHGRHTEHSRSTLRQRQRPSAGSRRNEKIGIVVSTKMQKTIVVEIEMRKAHPKYKRVMKSNKKFYAHDEQNSARVGDVVRIRETRPLSKLKRWSLEEIVRRSSLSRAGLRRRRPSRR